MCIPSPFSCGNSFRSLFLHLIRPRMNLAKKYNRYKTMMMLTLTQNDVNKLLRPKESLHGELWNGCGWAGMDAVTVNTVTSTKIIELENSLYCRWTCVILSVSALFVWERGSHNSFLNVFAFEKWCINRIIGRRHIECGRWSLHRNLYSMKKEMYSFTLIPKSLWLTLMRTHNFFRQKLK